jgi:hypothetical protein
MSFKHIVPVKPAAVKPAPVKPKPKPKAKKIVRRRPIGG